MPCCTIVYFLKLLVYDFINANKERDFEGWNLKNIVPLFNNFVPSSRTHPQTHVELGLIPLPNSIFMSKSKLKMAKTF